MNSYNSYGYSQAMNEPPYGYVGYGSNGYGGASGYASGFSPSPYAPSGYGSASSSYGNFSPGYSSHLGTSQDMSSPSRVARDNSIQIPRPRGRKDKEKDEKSSHNTVFVENIRSGTDVRTTVGAISPHLKRILIGI